MLLSILDDFVYYNLSLLTKKFIVGAVREPPVPGKETEYEKAWRSDYWLWLGG